ncbi:MAG: UDP-N-acetylmuramate--L-alanine ligase [Candidatus Komeilibacteria bacterium]
MEIYSKYKKIYLAGIGGIGISAIARLFKYHNASVAGSDAAKSSITEDLEKAGIKVNYDQVEDNIDEDLDLFIYTAAFPKDHPERIKAEKVGADIYSYPEFLGLLSKYYSTIAVSGTHGKSSTTSMLGLILSEAGLDPTVIVGSQVKGFDHNLRIGKSNILLIEACEYKGHMLLTSPEYICLTNIEEDHLDYYKDLADIEDHFSRFITKVDNTKLFLNIDNPSLFQFNEEVKANTYSIDTPAKYQAANIFINNNKQYFDLYISNKKVQQICLSVPGKFNVYNALAAIAVADSLGVKPEVYKKVLSEYTGCWRRFEILGSVKTRKTSLLISDYAHHPTAVSSTIKAAKEFYPDKRLIAVFEPHQHSRTKELFEDFVKAFSLADYVIISEIYDVKGREEAKDQVVSSKDLVDEIINRGQLREDQIEYSPSLKATKARILAETKAEDIVLVMGAGDIDSMARKLI